MTFDALIKQICDDMDISTVYITAKIDGKRHNECDIEIGAIDKYPCLGRLFNESDSEVKTGAGYMSKRSMMLYMIKQEQPETLEEKAAICDECIELLKEFVIKIRAYGFTVDYVRDPYRSAGITDNADVGATCQIDVTYNPCKLKSM